MLNFSQHKILSKISLINALSCQILSILMTDFDEQSNYSILYYRLAGIADHELMFPARVRTFKSQLGEISDEIFSFDGSKGWHQATSLTVSAIPSIVGN